MDLIARNPARGLRGRCQDQGERFAAVCVLLVAAVVVLVGTLMGPSPEKKAENLSRD
jgi:hypothetical protein